jgi:hypothetical protein
MKKGSKVPVSESALKMEILEIGYILHLII